MRSIGRMLGVSDDAAQKRIARALEKLRAHLTRRVFTFGTLALAAILEADASAASVPAGLAATVSAEALNRAAQVTFSSILRTTITSKRTLGLAAALALTAVTTVLIGKKQPAGNKADKTAASASSAETAAQAYSSASTPKAAATASAQSNQQSASIGSVPPGALGGAGGGSTSPKVRIVGDKMIIATTETGVTRTETRPLPSAGTTVTTPNSTGESGFPVAPTPDGQDTPNGYAITTVTDKDGNVQTKRTEYSASSDGKVHAGATVGVVTEGGESSQTVVVHDHTPPEKSAETSRSSAPAP